MSITIISLAVYISFLFVTADIIKKRKWTEIFLLLFSLFLCSFGEYLNLRFFKATAYTDTDGVPAYILLGGTLISWGYYKSTLLISSSLKKKRILLELLIFLCLTILFPLVEICGIALGLWYWLKPYSFTSPGWIIGVWKYYMLFLGTPAVLALVLSHCRTVQALVYNHEGHEDFEATDEH